MLLVAVTQAIPEVAALEESQGLSALGLNVSGLVFQVINFAVLLAVLYWFAFRPLLRVLHERRKTIEESLQSAADMEKAKVKLEQETRQIVARARRQAEEIMKGSEREAALVRERAEGAGKAAADRLLQQAQAHMTQQIAEAKTDLKQEVLRLTVATAEHILHEKIDDQKDQALIEEAFQAAEKALEVKRRLSV